MSAFVHVIPEIGYLINNIITIPIHVLFLAGNLIVVFLTPSCACYAHNSMKGVPISMELIVSMFQRLCSCMCNYGHMHACKNYYVASIPWDKLLI